MHPTQHNNHPPSHGSWATTSNRLPVYRNFHHWSFYHHFPSGLRHLRWGFYRHGHGALKVRASSSRGNFCWLVTGTSGSSEKMLLGRLAFPLEMVPFSGAHPNTLQLQIQIVAEKIHQTSKRSMFCVSSLPTSTKNMHQPTPQKKIKHPMNQGTKGALEGMRSKTTKVVLGFKTDSNAARIASYHGALLTWSTYWHSKWTNEILRLI